jgi:hypothetical protein
MGKALAVLLAGVVGVVLVGWLAVSVLGPVLFYLIVGVVVIRTQRRIEAAQKTYRMRNR